MVVSHSGPCKPDSVCERLDCNKHAMCSDVSGRKECTCATCSPVYNPICGNNNQTYNSECELYRTACLENDSELELDYYGTCTSNPCSSATCSAPYSVCGPEATCHCPTCNHVFDRGGMCGSDGVHYDNLCQLQRAACLSRETIRSQPLQFCGKSVLKIVFILHKV